MTAATECIPLQCTGEHSRAESLPLPLSLWLCSFSSAALLPCILYTCSFIQRTTSHLILPPPSSESHTHTQMSSLTSLVGALWVAAAAAAAAAVAALTFAHPSMAAALLPPFASVQLFVDSQCTLPFTASMATSPPFVSTLTFLNWTSLPSASVLTSVSAAPSSAPCVPSPLAGVQSAQYICQQGQWMQQNFTLVQVEEWSSAVNCPHSPQSLPAGERSFFSFASSTSSSPNQCLSGFYTNA